MRVGLDVAPRTQQDPVPATAYNGPGRFDRHGDRAPGQDGDPAPGQDGDHGPAGHDGPAAGPGHAGPQHARGEIRELERSPR